MRILLITDDYLPHQGGSRVYYHHLLQHLAGVERVVLTRSRPGDRQFDREQPYRIDRFSWRHSEFLSAFHLHLVVVYLRLLWHSVRAFLRYRPDVVLAGEMVPTGPVAALLAALFHRPFVLFTHAEAPATLIRTRWQSRLARWVCRRAGAIVVSSEHARRILAELWGVAEGKITVLTPGVGEEHLSEDFLASPCADSAAGRRLLSVARLVRRKGHMEVLEALPEVLQRVPELRYTIVGSGPLEPDLRAAAARLRLQDRVVFRGNLDSGDLLAEYADSDCFVLPNVDDPQTGDTEGLGIVFIEASAHGLPVVGGRTGGTEGAVLEGRTGVRVDGRDCAALVSALVSILSQPDLARRYGAEGRRFAMTEMRWPGRAAMLHDLLDRMSSGSASR